ncbi:hypothetical protein ACFL2K_03425 [Candidatus Margulisiibacteriota bacterium]
MQQIQIKTSQNISLRVNYPLVEKNLLEKRAIDCINKYLQYANKGVLKKYGLQRPEQILADLKGPGFYIQKVSGSWRRVIGQHDVIYDYMKACRKFVNCYLDDEVKIKYFSQKLAPYKRNIQDFLHQLYPDLRFCSYNLIEVQDLSSSQDNQGNGQCVYKFTFNIDGRKIPLILKQAPYEKIINEYFASQYMQLCKMKNTVNISPLINNKFVLMQYVEDPEICSALFKNAELKPENEQYLDKLIPHLAQTAAAFDLVIRTDRYLGIFGEEIVGNYLWDKDKNLWPIDNEFILFPPGEGKVEDYWLKNSYQRDCVEISFLHTLRPELQKKYWPIYKEVYFKKLKELVSFFKSSEGAKKIREIMTKAYPPELVDKKFTKFRRSVHARDVENNPKSGWKQFVEEAYLKSKQFYIDSKKKRLNK